MLNIGFRVDASNKVGMGHLMESISLAESLKRRDNCDIFFLTKDFGPAIHILKMRGFGIEVINDSSEKNDIKKLSQTIKTRQAEILVVDLLEKNDEYFLKLKHHVKILVVILDDEKHRSVPGDVVVNFNIAQDKDYYAKLPVSNTIYCIGPEFMLLSEELHTKWRKEKIIPATCRTILVNQGGSDPFGLTAKIVKSLELLNLKQKIFVVVGGAVSNAHKKELERLKPKLKNEYRFEWNVTRERFYKLMSECDLAITAAGNTLYELALFGVPSIVVCHHEKHDFVARKFAEKNAVINLGIGTTLETNTIAEAIDYLLRSRKKRSELSTNAKKIVDGLGSKRIAEKVLETWQKYS